MHLRRVHIRNVRSIAELTWELPPGVSGPGWHVILGDNGSGKSSFLRSLALALVGPREAFGLRQSWDEWVRTGSDEATVELVIVPPGEDRIDRSSRRLAPGRAFEIVLRRGAHGITGRTGEGPFPDLWDVVEPAGWFCASYGPFRRFTGGDQELEKLYTSQPRLARHLSVFGEAVALTEALSWLQSLKFKQLEGNTEGDLLAPIFAFVNQPGFLPHEVRLRDVTSRGVDFVDANGFKVPVQELSDGYRSVLSMTFELVRQMALAYGTAGLFSADHTQVIPPGVVIVDEIDAHLHPSWQRTIGVWFRKHFPNVQFIVSTHSPLICQAAEVGTVFRLPQPGTDPSEDRGEMVTGLARKRLLYGNVLDAYGTGVFGDGVTRSESGQEKLERLAELNMRELVGTSSDDEKQAQTELREILPTEASITSPHDPAA
ncbi:MAG TPA: AAA family ATPase [Kofleriaceae bacterium]|jgi:energy-coupling factor transporter ATP-binding protein EcfA2|nr:AAA family ATPase [Kofleriaceae bacterium]